MVKVSYTCGNILSTSQSDTKRLTSKTLYTVINVGFISQIK